MLDPLESILGKVIIMVGIGMKFSGFRGFGIQDRWFVRGCVPHPCTNTNLTFQEQLKKVEDELQELKEAVNKDDRDAILEEGTDVIVAVTTLLAKRYDLKERLRAINEVNWKNRVRQYYMENQDTLRCLYCSKRENCKAVCDAIQVPSGVYFN